MASEDVNMKYEILQTTILECQQWIERRTYDSKCWKILTQYGVIINQWNVILTYTYIDCSAEELHQPWQLSDHHVVG
jgi:hypothetical protein